MCLLSCSGFLSLKSSLSVSFPPEKLAEAQRRFATLQNELQSSLDAQRESWANGRGLRRMKTVFALSQQERCKHRNIKDLQLAFSEFYLSLILLQNYQVHIHTHTDVVFTACSWPPSCQNKSLKTVLSNELKYKVGCGSDNTYRLIHYYPHYSVNAETGYTAHSVCILSALLNTAVPHAEPFALFSSL